MRIRALIKLSAEGKPAPPAAPGTITVPHAAVSRLPSYLTTGKYQGLRPADRQTLFRREFGAAYQRQPGGGIKLDLGKLGIDPANADAIRKQFSSGAGPLGNPTAATMPREHFPTKQTSGIPTYGQYKAEQRRRPPAPFPFKGEPRPRTLSLYERAVLGKKQEPLPEQRTLSLVGQRQAVEPAKPPTPVQEAVRSGARQARFSTYQTVKSMEPTWLSASRSMGLIQ